MCEGKKECCCANGEECLSPQMEKLYEDAISNIQFLKRQQWMATNYTLVIFAALYGLKKEIAPHIGESNLGGSLLSMVAFLTLCAAIFTLNNQQASLRKFRRRLVYIYERYFTCEQREELALSLSQETKGHDFLWLLTATIVLAFAILMAIVWLPAA